MGTNIKDIPPSRGDIGSGVNKQSLIEVDIAV